MPGPRIREPRMTAYQGDVQTTMLQYSKACHPAVPGRLASLNQTTTFPRAPDNNMKPWYANHWPTIRMAGLNQTTAFPWDSCSFVCEQPDHFDTVPFYICDLEMTISVHAQYVASVG